MNNNITNDRLPKWDLKQFAVTVIGFGVVFAVILGLGRGFAKLSNQENKARQINERQR